MNTVQRLVRHHSAQVGGLLVTATILVAVLAPLIAPEGYDDEALTARLEPPSRSSLFGTDQLGREVLSRIVWGARTSLAVGVLSVAISLVVGGALGLAAGYYGGMLDHAIMGLMDILLAFPGLLLAIAVVAILGPGLTNVMIAVGVARIPQFARLLRGSTLAAREQEYVEAEHALGAVDVRILFKHILPNVIAPVVVVATLNIGTAILAAAGMSFIGLGAQPPVPDWGSMVSEGRAYLRSAWWVAIFPGLAIMLTILGFNLLGDGLRDALDPRVRL